MTTRSEDNHSYTLCLKGSGQRSSEDPTGKAELQKPPPQIREAPEIALIDLAIEKHVVRKLDMRLMTLVCGLCMFPSAIPKHCVYSTNPD